MKRSDLDVGQLWQSDDRKVTVRILNIRERDTYIEVVYSRQGLERVHLAPCRFEDFCEEFCIPVIEIDALDEMSPTEYITLQ